MELKNILDPSIIFAILACFFFGGIAIGFSIGILNAGNLISGFSVFVALLVLSASFHFNKKTLEQTEKNLKIQLMYDDEKKQYSS